jgi:hypothetical protein
VLGELDHYLTDLADIIERAKNCVTIVCDYPAYGTFADPKGAEAYYRAIEDRLIQGVTIRVIFLTKERRNALNDTFWTQEDAWTPDFRERVDWYVNTRLHNSTPSSDHVARPELLDVLEQESLMVIDRLNTAARTGFARHGKQLLSRRETSSLMPVYCWVRDGAEAAFAIAMLKEGRNKETAFATVDPGLVAVLEGVYDRYLEEAATLTDELAPTMP